MLNMRNLIHVCFGLGCVAVACSETKRAPTSTDTVSAPASEQSDEPTPNPPAPGPAASEAPAPSATPPSDACAGLECPDGYCDVKTVECIRAPCPPVATCVTGTHPCAAATCLTNTRCESHDGQPVCVPLANDRGGVACGANTCAAGQVCCNASCGICTAPDGACTQQACEPAK